MTHGINDLIKERNELSRKVSQSDRDWLAMLREVAKLSDAMNVDDGDWVLAADDTLQEQFDPWVVIKKAIKAVEPARIAMAAVEEIANYVTSDEGDEDTTEGTFGLDFSEVIEMAHDSMIVIARQAVAAAS